MLYDSRPGAARNRAIVHPQHWYTYSAIIANAPTSLPALIRKSFSPGIPGAENAAIDYENNRIFVASGSNTSVNSFDFDIDDNVTTADIVPSVNILIEPAFDALGLEPPELGIQDITCVAMSSKGYILATVVPMNHSITNGWLAFINPTNQSVFHLLEMEDCFLPDHVISTFDGDTILVSCEV